jgi:two-component system nitrate/nitrite response regulator NarL
MMTRTGTVRIAVISPREIFRESLGTLLSAQPGFSVVIRTGCDVNTVEQVSGSDPDVILLDRDAPDDSCVSMVRAFVHMPTTMKTILFSDAPRQEPVFELFEAGLRGVLAKDAPLEMLFKCIRYVSLGEYWIGRDRIGDLMEYQRQMKYSAASPENEFGLTARERDVLRALLTGATNKEIAQSLSISSQAVRHHLCSIFVKVGVSNRLELGLFAVQKGLVESDLTFRLPEGCRIVSKFGYRASANSDKCPR